MNFSISISSCVLPSYFGSLIMRRSGDGVSASLALRRKSSTFVELFRSIMASRSSSMLAMPPLYTSRRTGWVLRTGCWGSKSSSICHGFLVRTGAGACLRIPASSRYESGARELRLIRPPPSSSLSPSLSEYLSRTGRPFWFSIAALRRNTAMPTSSVLAPVLPTRGLPAPGPSTCRLGLGTGLGLLVPPPNRLSSSARSARSSTSSPTCLVSLECIARSISSSNLPAALTSAYIRAHGPAKASNFCHKSNAGDMKC
mmetsp:Transcript_6222/g.28058  ORF Transcript_6222/g.28058 Transcript_6222/m.28058 type:complete len:257 (-) Transcript_6222:640-1410(-)